MRSIRETIEVADPVMKMDHDLANPPVGIWTSTGERRHRRGVAGLFLDRDGVIVREVNYLHRVEDVELEGGAAEIIDAASTAGLAVVIITNQAGIDRGYFGWEDFEAVEREIGRQLGSSSPQIDLVVACAFHPDATPDYTSSHAAWRKPGPRMIEYAAYRLGIDLAESWMIGDKASDIEAARAAGLAGAIHVLTGHGPQHRHSALSLARPGFAVLAADDLVEARHRLSLC